MAEPGLDLPPTATKADRYRRLAEVVPAVLAGETNRVAQMATVSCLLAAAFPTHLWAGFYVVDPERPTQLVVGPYQGSLGCLRIDVGRGVCGTCAATLRTQVVADVHAFPGHIACDARSRSEIVVPVFDENGDLMAVLDIDSPELSAFDSTDAVALQALMATVFGAPAGPSPERAGGIG